MSKFKVGDKAMLSKDSEYIENEDGEVCSNAYGERDLVLVEEAAENNKVLKMIYKNYKGEYSVREIIPKGIVFKNSSWHGECWIMEAYDLGKEVDREFKVEDIVKWL